MFGVVLLRSTKVEKVKQRSLENAESALGCALAPKPKRGSGTAGGVLNMPKVANLARNNYGGVQARLSQNINIKGAA